MFVFWDTERINNTKIYMLGYIIADNDFNIIEQNILIDNSIDLSKRNSPRIKKQKLLNQSIVCKDFDDFINHLKGKIIDTQNLSVCFGQEEYVSLNDQLKLHEMEPIEGSYFDAKELSLRFDIGHNQKCNHLSYFAKQFNYEHEAHNPLSDSILTLLLFKHIKNSFIDQTDENLLSQIPNKKKILDSKVVESMKKESANNV